MAIIGKSISEAKELLNHGELVGLPTETVYGLAGNALNTDAVSKIFQVKNRPHFDPLILHTYHLDQIARYTKNIPDKAKALAEN